MKKQLQIIMLPTKEATSLLKFDGILFKTKQDSISPEGQHLYLISDEEIKEGDLYYDKYTKRIGKFNDARHFKSLDLDKIIATTDKSLGIELIPQSFVQEYVAKQGNITEVNVEYEAIQIDRGCVTATIDLIKLNSDSNEVIITPVKDSWSREEVIKLIKKFNKEATIGCCSIFMKENSKHTYEVIEDNWIKQNL